MKQRVVGLLLIASLLLAGCSVASSAPATVPAVPVATLDIAGTVTAQIDQRLAQQEPTPDLAALEKPPWRRPWKNGWRPPARSL